MSIKESKYTILGEIMSTKIKMKSAHEVMSCTSYSEITAAGTIHCFSFLTYSPIGWTNLLFMNDNCYQQSSMTGILRQECYSG